MEFAPSSALPVNKMHPATVDLGSSPDGKIGSPETVKVPVEVSLDEVDNSGAFQVKPTPADVGGNQSPKDEVLSLKDAPSEARTPPTGKNSLSDIIPEHPVGDSDAKGSVSDFQCVSDDMDKPTDNTGSPLHPKHGDSSERSVEPIYVPDDMDKMTDSRSSPVHPKHGDSSERPEEPKLIAAPKPRSARSAMFDSVVRNALDPTQDPKARQKLASALNSRSAPTDKKSVPYPYSDE